MIAIRAARFPDDAAAVEAIFREYVASPTVSLAFQDYEPEIAALPGKYAAPRGQLLRDAKAAGYARMCLDVLPEFVAARQLYASLGFTPAPPVAFNPVPGTDFLGRDL
ncbi:hypothetical protein H3O04_13610 [Burkholderia sp. KCJ3K979]|uniref:GNAT family N-acetyltransferase n=1 Tax=Burkholderia sp. KCJ3K979 TaxID=2759149 RepID=UPI001929B729|nr:hypothetical protein [Burkholderia sp. KCJ3K979]MBL3963537.1 hypothetical protein [Burkholderia sp. KCJ3K979]